MLASQRGGPGSRPSTQSVWDLWWAEWCRDRVLPKSFGFSVSVSLNRWLLHMHACVVWVRTVVPLAAHLHRRIPSQQCINFHDKTCCSAVWYLCCLEWIWMFGELCQSSKVCRIVTSCVCVENVCCKSMCFVG